MQGSGKLAWSNAPLSGSLADPNGSNAVVAAVQWLQGTVLGTAATSLAVVSVAAVGLMMLSGRIDVRRGATVVVGCFVIFGAASIAGGIQSAVGTDTAYVAPPPAPAIRTWAEPPVAGYVDPWLPPPPSPPPPGTSGRDPSPRPPPPEL